MILKPPTILIGRRSRDEAGGPFPANRPLHFLREPELKKVRYGYLGCFVPDLSRPSPILPRSSPAAARGHRATRGRFSVFLLLEPSAIRPSIVSRIADIQKAPS